jgi:hypothetical protein
MRILLDTCAFIWLVTDDPKLSERAKEIFLDNDNELLLTGCSGDGRSHTDIEFRPAAFRLCRRTLVVIPGYL